MVLLGEKRRQRFTDRHLVVDQQNLLCHTVLPEPSVGRESGAAWRFRTPGRCSRDYWWSADASRSLKTASQTLERGGIAGRGRVPQAQREARREDVDDADALVVAPLVRLEPRQHERIH